MHLKVKAWSPYGDTGYAVAWSGNTASVFAWDQDSLSERINELGYDPGTCDIVPEVFLREPQEDGVRLVSSNVGIEAQFWSQGILKSTRWWPSAPPPHDWSLFIRSSGASTATEAPAIQSPDWLDFPWNSSNISSDFLTQAIRNRKFVVTACTLMLAPCAFLAAEWASYSAMTARLSNTIAALEQQSVPVRLDRTNALTSLEATEDLASLTPYPHQIEIFSRAHSLLQGYPITLANWDYDEGALEFGILSDTDIDARVFITAFEDDSLFSSVSASTVGRRLVMRMNVDGKQDP